MRGKLQLTKEQLMQFGALFGPPAVLTTESSDRYDAIWNALLETLVPRDFLEMLLIKQVQVETWKWLRYNHHQSLGIERRFRQSLEFQIARRKEQKARREALARDLAEKSGRPVTDFDRLLDLEGIVESTITDTDELLSRIPTEIEHNKALEDGIVFQEQLDKLGSHALRRRNQALELLELYREGLGQYWQRLSDAIIDGVAAEAPPMAPVEVSDAATAPAGGESDGQEKQ